VIAVVDAGLGNLRSVEKALAHVGANVVVTGDPEVVASAERVVVPGQGAFGDCGRALAREAPLGQAILYAIAQGRPYLGICLGLQVLFDASEEAPGCRGLGVLRGEVVRIPSGMVDPASGARLKVPHMGWNAVAPSGRQHPLLPVAPTPYYFVHSYHARPADPTVVAGAVQYGARPLTAAVARDNVFAVQFHPEKSQRAGLALLLAFVGWRP
jgi:imidazole glycerol-phosphate synthase subunit HisH